MKVLIFFVDMLRANLLKTFNPLVAQEGAVDRFLRSLGGTAYTRCFTPAPDTGRGLACAYTGLYPRGHGCFARRTYPKFFLKPQVGTLFDLFLSHGYFLNICCSEYYEQYGVLPARINAAHKGIEIRPSLSDNIAAVEKKWDSHENLLFLVVQEEYHAALDRYGYTESPLLGQQSVVKTWRAVFERLEPDAFDVILIFSDHGFRPVYQRATEDALYFLGDDRCQVVMLLRRKEEGGLKYCHDLTSVMDILPTFHHILGSPLPAHSLDGCSLLAPVPDRSVVMEEASTLKSSLTGMRRDVWGVRTARFAYYETPSDSVLFTDNADGLGRKPVEADPALIRGFRKKIAEKSVSYNQYMRLHQTAADQLGLYKTYSEPIEYKGIQIGRWTFPALERLQMRLRGHYAKWRKKLIKTPIRHWIKVLDRLFLPVRSD